MDKETINQNLSPLALSALTAFRGLLHSIALFHAVFWGLMAFEIILIALFFSFLVQSALVAVSIALLTLTVFCYFVLKLWVYTKKRQDFSTLADAFQESIQRLMGQEEHTFSYYGALTKSLLTLSDALKKNPSPSWGENYIWMKPFHPFIAFGYKKLTSEDLLFIQELILGRTSQLWLEFIRKAPTHLEAHAALASTYITFSTFFAEEKKHKERFTALVQKAAEEFKILSDYSPNDVWAHTQLAYTYHDLNMRREEIKEYEAILALQPKDSDTLFKLGVLYFQEGFASKALSLYEELKKLSPQKSEELINFYA
ncbi:MAG: hypothetical protein WCN87_04225 [Chlamydiota bacterium]